MREGVLAGYDGMAIDLGAGDVEQAHAVRPHMEHYGLTLNRCLSPNHQLVA